MQPLSSTAVRGAVLGSVSYPFNRLAGLVACLLRRKLFHPALLTKLSDCQLYGPVMLAVKSRLD